MTVRVQVAERRNVPDRYRFSVVGGSISLGEEKRRIFPYHWPLLFMMVLHLRVVQILPNPDHPLEFIVLLILVLELMLMLLVMVMVVVGSTPLGHFARLERLVPVVGQLLFAFTQFKLAFAEDLVTINVDHPVLVLVLMLLLLL